MNLRRLRSLWNPDARSSGDTPETLVAELYRGLLGREPDHGGLHSHADALRSGVALADIARSMVESDEFSQRQKYLRVPPTELPDLTALFSAALSAQPGRHQHPHDLR